MEPPAPETTADRRPPEQREVVVVGGGRTGLAIGYFLAQQERDFVVLEAGRNTT